MSGRPRVAFGATIEVPLPPAQAFVLLHRPGRADMGRGLAALVTVQIEAVPAGSRVRVDYDATALRAEADDAPRELAAHGEEHVGAWEVLIRRHLDLARA